MPWIAQVLWNDVDFDWDQSEALYLTAPGRRSGLKEIDIDRTVLRGNARADTCRITAYDDGTWVVPGKTGPGSIHPQLGLRVRVLAQDPVATGTWYPHFFGYISSIDPNPNDPNPPEVQITVDSPLAALASLSVTLPTLTNPKVYDADDPDNSALVAVLKAANLWDFGLYLDLEPVGATALSGTWGGTKTVGQALAELTTAADTVIAIEPYYATGSTDPDWRLHWFQPSPVAAPVIVWNATSPHNDLEPSPHIVFNGEQP